MSTSVGRCGPCCSTAPIGSSTTSPFAAHSPSSAAVSSPQSFTTRLPLSQVTICHKGGGGDCGGRSQIEPSGGLREPAVLDAGVGDDDRAGDHLGELLLC